MKSNKLPTKPVADDELDKYYNYEVQSEAEVKNEIRLKKREKISTVTTISAIVFSMLSVVFGAISFAHNSKSLAAISLILVIPTIVSISVE